MALILIVIYMYRPPQELVDFSFSYSSYALQ